MTGGNNNADKNVNALFLSLEPDELRVLYSAVDAVVVMSKLNEGWNRVAHEAILSSTVVIGSGVSGMAELLQVSNQYICDSIDDLSNLLKVIINGKTPASASFDFIKKYDLNYFESSWISRIEN